MRNFSAFVLMSVSALALSVPALAAGIVPGEAESRIVGVNPTASGPVGQLLPGGGDARYLPDRPRLNGVVGLLMDYGTFTSGQNQGQPARFVCSGSLIAGGHILTAAHCVRPRTGVSSTNPTVTASFYGGPDDVRYYPSGAVIDPGVVQVGVSDIFINPDYSGFVIDQADVAILRLGAAAPDFARVYKLTNRTDLTGLEFNVAGLGTRSFGGGNVGTTPPNGGATGWLRQGLNRYDFRYGDPDFGGFFLQPSRFNTRADHVWLADFDNGLAQQDLSCRIAAGFDLGGPKYCNLGLGLDEVNTAGGDSGGPQFIFGYQISSVTSFGQRYVDGNGDPFGDIDRLLNSSFGEFAGHAPVAIHRAWIDSIVTGAFVPEPATWAMMIAGFGLVGVAARRRRTTIASA